jgi:hypothetical protein
MPWNTENGTALADIATRGGFISLRSLVLSQIEHETDQSHEALSKLLEKPNPLHRLVLSGHISKEVFEVIIRRHGRALCSLSLRLYKSRHCTKPLVVLSAAVFHQLAENCPKLEQLVLPLVRSRGDSEETGIYRASSRLPRLRRAFLRLTYTIGPDRELLDEEKDGEHPYDAAEIGHSGTPHSSDLPRDL